jgi:hypothetical protein
MLVARGCAGVAALRAADRARARSLAEEAAVLLEGGAPSLLNESPVFLALHDACAGDGEAAREAVRRGLVPLTRRLAGLRHTPYARLFVSALPHNEALLSHARDYGLVPADIASIFPPESPPRKET